MAKVISAKSRIAKYRADRDFAKTSEPAGKKAVPSSSTLCLVIQRHDARPQHYDFRLELNGVSTAVTRGNLSRSDKRLAVEDHALEYGDFEGTIPKGQYGGGIVQLWDRGYWFPEGDPHEGVNRRPEILLGRRAALSHLSKRDRSLPTTGRPTTSISTVKRRNRSHQHSTIASRPALLTKEIDHE